MARSTKPVGPSTLGSVAQVSGAAEGRLASGNEGPG